MQVEVLHHINFDHNVFVWKQNFTTIMQNHHHNKVTGSFSSSLIHKCSQAVLVFIL